MSWCLRVLCVRVFVLSFQMQPLLVCKCHYRERVCGRSTWRKPWGQGWLNETMWVRGQTNSMGGREMGRGRNDNCGV